ncbi:carboxymuconolactone decarboxylase family protein [Geotalea sp. SG265]|uniref:carboxymuconolactone decarboxylase family protein n=1 Tax=Geotalea sp. SG265 TaxID=2922867 RepID=UPI001FB038FD|nr:carboxymuconolactone decarboxylase family protein [Geotalea sp. SG265]
MQNHLNAKQRAIIPIAAFTANGDLSRLKTALSEGLDAGLTVNEIKEILVQLYAYAGFPRSLNGIGTFMAVMDERGKKGIKDEMGKEASPMPTGKNSLESGTKNQTKLVGQPVTGPLYDFAPAFDRFLKAHLFGDIFQRDVLNWQDRELATVAALASIEGVDPQLQGHMVIGMHNGLTPGQLRELVNLLRIKCGGKVADNAEVVLDQVLKNSKEKNMGQIHDDAASGGVFPRGNLNEAYARYFTGTSYLNMLSTERVVIGNVTFEPGCRNFWHIHHKGGQILLVTGGRGWYQEWGKPARELHAGDVVNIAPETKHWHGAAKDSWFSHVAVEVPAEGGSSEWLEPVSDEEYQQLP